MDKSAIRTFAIEARKMLMKSAETEAGFYGVTKDGCKNPVQKGIDFEVYETIAGTENRIYGEDIKKRANLVKAVETSGFEQVIEETAYTWFNRIIAIRFMEVNDYLPTRTRVLSSETGSSTPDIVTQFLDIDLNMTPEEIDKVQKAKDENRYDDAFRMLFVKQCNELNAILPGLFEKTNDYMELLLKLSYTSDGVVRMLIDTIDENNFNVETEGQVEIIGWMYQYYNTELKDDTFAKLKKNVKITKERIPAATQLFTPDWIVRYMVENSVGRVWIEHLRALDSSVDEKEKAEEFGWKYYLPEAEQEEEVQKQLVEIRKNYENLEPKDINCIDPCMGSGHILVYMFDVLMDIYRSEGFSDRDAVFSILENNIRGLDIDKRAYQLSYFALMMKARSYNRTFFRGKKDEEENRVFVEPSVYAIEESNDVNREQLKYFGAGLNEIEKNNAMNQIVGLLDALKDAKEYGSILNVQQYDWILLEKFGEEYDVDSQISFETYGIDDTQNKIISLIEQGKIMANKYWVVSTNPPYMGVANGSIEYNNFIKKLYPAGKIDLYSVFIEKCNKMTKEYGKYAMITQHSWMFLSSFELLREIVLKNVIVNMLHLGARAFDEIAGEVVQTVAFVISKNFVKEYKGKYHRLLEYGGEKRKEEAFFSKCDEYVFRQKEYSLIAGKPLAYWISDRLMDSFINDKPLSTIAITRRGLQTGNAPRFIRCWYEVDLNKILLPEKDSQGKKWYFLNSGGSYRKWYGNIVNVVNWEESGKEIKDTGKAIIPSEDLYLKQIVSWNKISSGKISVRYQDSNIIPGDASPFLYTEDSQLLLYLQAFMNSKVADAMIKVISPTLNFEVGNLAKLPIKRSNLYEKKICDIAKECIELVRTNWNEKEISYDYSRNILLNQNTSTVKVACEKAREYLKNNARLLKEKEETINKLFIELYGLENELDSSVKDDELSIDIMTEQELVKSLISYAIGCMFGRYSLDENGVVYAGGIWEKEHYSTYIPDNDGIIPITDTDYFNDDIISRFEEFIYIIFGEDTLEENLTFIADVIGTKGNTSREKIRNYFISDFLKNHINTYSITGSGKRPIYWLFDSGKQNGFKCLIYMHRYNKDTLNLIRSEYLRKTEDAVENALENAEYIIQTSASAVERAKATKDRDRYVKQLNEMRIYYQALSHLALQKIEIDLDDGVKHNYQLFQGVEVIADGGKKQKVDLLAKI